MTLEERLAYLENLVQIEEEKDNLQAAEMGLYYSHGLRRALAIMKGESD